MPDVTVSPECRQLPPVPWLCGISLLAEQTECFWEHATSRNAPKVYAEGESQNAAPLVLYLEEQCLGVVNINGGWSDAKALLAISDGCRGAPSLRASPTSAQWPLFGALGLVHRWGRTQRSCCADTTCSDGVGSASKCLPGALDYLNRGSWGRLFAGQPNPRLLRFLPFTFCVPMATTLPGDHGIVENRRNSISIAWASSRIQSEKTVIFRVALFWGWYSSR